MQPESCQGVSYKRARFATRLPEDRRYTANHFWLQRQEDGRYRVGFTRFATRMLGELVEHEFEVKPGMHVKAGQIIGWVEGFKAVSDLFSVIAGEFVGGNAELDNDIRLIDIDPYGRGWLYEVNGTPDANTLDVQGYIAHLDRVIDQAQGKTV